MNSIYEMAKKGQPLEDILVIDSHCHMGCYHQFNAPHNDVGGMLESMDTLGVDMVMVTAHASIGPDYIYGNNMVLDAIKKYPDRFLGYVTLNPHYPEDMLHELERCLAVPGMKGIKLHPTYHGVPIDHENYRAAYEFANRHQYPMLIHVWGIDQVKSIGRLAGQYPDIRLMIGHSGGDFPAMEEAVRVANSHINVYCDLARAAVREGNVEWLVDKIGSEKVLYASDMPYFDPRPALGRVAMSRLTEKEKKNVLGLNIKRILSM